eukprot:TRINITY_DN4107_c0_g1_i1.p1 TRINITY_DN4107_c0_g1~~TRINITY_DN4107_c0_g1_i1.p1  ORF type:complete len:173 (+),score=42.37 TRINITY_DN4107_c0_g1_i1:183-701(+)
MTPMNSLLQKYSDTILYFLSTLSKLPLDYVPTSLEVSYLQMVESLSIFRKEFEMNEKKFEPYLKRLTEGQELLLLLPKLKSMPLAADPTFLRAQPGLSKKRQNFTVKKNECPLEDEGDVEADDHYDSNMFQTYGSSGSTNLQGTKKTWSPGTPKGWVKARKKANNVDKAEKY